MSYRRLLTALLLAIPFGIVTVALAQHYVVVRLTDPLLYHCPILHMEDVGVARFSDDEGARRQVRYRREHHSVRDDALREIKP